MPPARKTVMVVDSDESSRERLSQILRRDYRVLRAGSAEAGLGLMDYLSNTQIDQWVKEKVLLPAATQQCAIPAGIYGQAGGAMLRGIAYGNELNLLHPPRPTDPKLLAAWNPEWSLRVRVKSTTMSMLGQEAAPARQERKSEPSNPLDILKKGLFGR